MSAGLVEKLPVMFLSRDPMCSFRPPSKMAVWNAWIIRHMTLYFHPCQAISPFEKVRFRQQHRSWTDLSGNERGKRRNEEEKGFDMGWSGQTGIKTLYGRTKKSMSAECEVMCSLFDVILPELSYFSLPLGIGEVGWSSHTQRYP